MEDGEVLETRSVRAERITPIRGEPTGVGKRIRQAIKETGLRQGDVAAQLGVSERTVGMWVAGDTIPEGLNLTHLSDLVKRGPRWILTGETDDLQELRATVEKLVSRVEILERRLDG